MAKKIKADEAAEEITEGTALKVEFDYGRFTENRSATWTGTTGCCSKSNINRQARAEFNRFLKAVKKKYNVVAAWTDTPHARCWGGRSPTTGRKFCNGSVSMNVTVEYLLKTSKKFKNSS